MPGAQEHISELQEVEQAMQRELFYRYVIRYWRKFHILLALLTLALTTLASHLCRPSCFYRFSYTAKSITSSKLGAVIAEMYLFVLDMNDHIHVSYLY